MDDASGNDAECIAAVLNFFDVTMNPAGTPAWAPLREEPIPCAECGSTSRVGRGLCLNCLLWLGLGADTSNNETLEDVLAEIDVRDPDWRLGNITFSTRSRVAGWELFIVPANGIRGVSSR